MFAVHHFYHELCVACGDFNHTKRTQSADLSGQVALLTGGRVRIGYRIALRLLRAGAECHVSTTGNSPTTTYTGLLIERALFAFFRSHPASLPSKLRTQSAQQVNFQGRFLTDFFRWQCCIAVLPRARLCGVAVEFTFILS